MSERLEDKYEYMCKLCEEYASRLAEATSINTIVRDIIVLTDGLNSKEELKKAWREIRLALDYLSAKDSMFRSREELREKMEEHDSDR